MQHSSLLPQQAVSSFKMRLMSLSSLSPCTLYSLLAHLTQRGCGLYGAYKVGMLVYFPTFVLPVDMLLDCHFSYKPLCHCAPLSTLRYVQPQCPPTLYPSEMSLSLCNVTLGPVTMDDNSDESVLTVSGNMPSFRSHHILPHLPQLATPLLAT
jgi:hypothetical protein